MYQLSFENLNVCQSKSAETESGSRNDGNGYHYMPQPFHGGEIKIHFFSIENLVSFHLHFSYIKQT